MSEQIFSADTDLKEAQAMTNALEGYLLGDELYGRVGSGGLFGGGKMPALTIGALLLRLRRLRVLADRLTPQQRSMLAPTQPLLPPHVAPRTSKL